MCYHSLEFNDVFMLQGNGWGDVCGERSLGEEGIFGGKVRSEELRKRASYSRASVWRSAPAAKGSATIIGYINSSLITIKIHFRREAPYQMPSQMKLKFQSSSLLPPHSSLYSRLTKTSKNIKHAFSPSAPSHLAFSLFPSYNEHRKGADRLTVTPHQMLQKNRFNLLGSGRFFCALFLLLLYRAILKNSEE